MSEENVEIVEAINHALNQDDGEPCR